MKTFIIKKTIELYFEINPDNWTKEQAESIAPYIDDVDAYHSITYYSALEVKEKEKA
jgi:hypothetical protein